MKHKLYENTLALLEEVEATRVNDFTLFLEYIKRYSNSYKGATCEEKELIIKAIMEVPPQSSIVRTRALIQNTIGLYKVDIAKRKRKVRENKIRAFFRNLFF